jgi:hypothetical protein
MKRPLRNRRSSVVTPTIALDTLPSGSNLSVDDFNLPTSGDATTTAILYVQGSGPTIIEFLASTFMVGHRPANNPCSTGRLKIWNQ